VFSTADGIILGRSIEMRDTVNDGIVTRSSKESNRLARHSSSLSRGRLLDPVNGRHPFVIRPPLDEISAVDDESIRWGNHWYILA
jgi:hypothetical protein